VRASFFRHSLLSRGGDKMVVAHANHLVSKGHEVNIITALFDTVFILDPRIKLIKLPSKNILSTIMIALKSKIGSDLVVADIIPMACFLFPQSRRRVVYYAQDYDESYYTSVLLKGLVRSFYRIGLSLFRIPTIAVSRPLADLLTKRFNARVAVAENGVDTGVFYPDPDQVLITAKDGRRALLLLSRSDHRKGFDIAQDVVKRLSVAHVDAFEVWTVGEPCDGLFPDIVHRDFGYVGEERLRQVMSSADIFFYPSRHEGFPLMPLESLACGCPVVTSDAVPYGRGEPSMKVTAIGDADAMTTILSELLAAAGLLTELRSSCSGVAARYNITECKRQFERLLVQNFGEVGCE